MYTEYTYIYGDEKKKNDSWTNYYLLLLNGQLVSFKFCDCDHFFSSFFDSIMNNEYGVLYASSCVGEHSESCARTRETEREKRAKSINKHNYRAHNTLTPRNVSSAEVDMHDFIIIFTIIMQLIIIIVFAITIIFRCRAQNSNAGNTITARKQ